MARVRVDWATSVARDGQKLKMLLKSISMMANDNFPELHANLDLL
jgi:hypothetical protein